MLRLGCVLLVDDDSTTQFLNRRLLIRLGIAEHVLEATNGQEALALIQAQCVDDFRTCPDLILLDVRMPILDGFGFLEAYWALPKAQQCAKVVAMLTVSLHSYDQDLIGPLSEVTVLTKPLIADKLSALLKDHFAPSRLLVRNLD